MVEKATVKIPLGASDSNSGDGWYPITVTEPFGGRGFDFMISDEDVDNAGGLAVIMTSIPNSEREWTQWIGRTARNDRKGQYLLVLKMPLSDVCDYQDVRHNGTSKYNPSLITAILESADEETRNRLLQLKETINIGKLLNELCDRFFQKFGGIGQIWPTNAHHEKLRDFLINSSSFTKASLLQFVVSSGLATSESEYEHGSQYLSSPLSNG